MIARAPDVPTVLRGLSSCQLNISMMIPLIDGDLMILPLVLCTKGLLRFVAIKNLSPAISDLISAVLSHSLLGPSVAHSLVLDLTLI